MAPRHKTLEPLHEKQISKLESPNDLLTMFLRTALGGLNLPLSRASSLIFFFFATSSTGIWKLCKPEEEAIVLNYVHDRKKPVKTWFDSLSFVFVVFLSSGGASSSLDCAPNIFLWSVAWERERSKTGGFLRWARYRSGACICGRYQSGADTLLHCYMIDFDDGHFFPTMGW